MYPVFHRLHHTFPKCVAVMRGSGTASDSIRTRKNGSQNCIIRTHPNNPNHLQKRYLDPSKHTKNTFPRSIYLDVLGYISMSFSSTTKSTRIKKHVDYSLATKQKIALRNFAAIKVGETLMFLGGSLR